jgi:hypothetical protein
MAEPVLQQLVRAAQDVQGMYNRLVLLVAPTGFGKTQALREYCEATGTPLINVNLELSRRMLELTARQRTLRLPVLFSEMLEQGQPEVVALDNLEILFDKSLQQDPLRLLQSASRNRSAVATWNGAATGRKLTYAEVGHPEYRSYELDDVVAVNMAGEALHQTDVNK